MFNILAITVAVFVAAVLVSAATKPDAFRVQRTLTMKATPERIVPLIENFYIWRSWSPFERKLDPALKRAHSGSARGKGAVYAWEGIGKAGAGRMEIIDSSSSQVTIKLDLIKPVEGHNIAQFTLEPRGDSTNVTWALRGPSPYLAKVATTFFNMDRVVGSEFETGLANLKAIAER